MINELPQADIYREWIATLPEAHHPEEAAEFLLDLLLGHLGGGAAAVLTVGNTGLQRLVFSGDRAEAEHFAHLGPDRPCHRALENSRPATAEVCPEAGTDLSEILLPFRYGPEEEALLVLRRSGPLYTPDEMAWLQEALPLLGTVLGLRRAFQRLERECATDPLTGLLTRRALFESLAVEIGRSERHGLQFALALCDLNGFKSINDNHGHLVGDLLLRLVGQVFLDNVRSEDRVGRYGGDEFVVIMPGADREGAQAVVHRILTALVTRTLPTDAGELAYPTFSFGLAQYPADGITDTFLLATADRELYRAKEKDRQLTLGD